MAAYADPKTSVLLRASNLPLVRFVFGSLTSMYSGMKDRYPLLGLMGDVAEGGVRSVSTEALRLATPLLQSLEPQIELANSLALTGLSSLEKNFPILNQSTDEVMTHLKDAFFLTLDDVQILVVDGLDGALDRLERAADSARAAVRQLQDTQVGQAATAGLDNILSLLEDTTAYYLPSHLHCQNLSESHDDVHHTQGERISAAGPTSQSSESMRRKMEDHLVLL